jgi:hypothetical protein
LLSLGATINLEVIKFLASLVLILTLSFVPSVKAQQGCCSWHGGVCGYTCCDGTPLSAKCGGGTYDSPSYYYAPSTPAFPEMTATYDFQPDLAQGFTVTIKLDDPNPSFYSVTLNKYKGGDPGPKADFNSPTFQFVNVKSGKWYLNVKKAMGGSWSQVAYWEVDVPTWYKSIPTPAPDYTLGTTQTQESTETDSGGWLALVGLVLAGAGILKIKDWIMKIFK